MTTTLQQVKNHIETMVCNEHGKNPIVYINKGELTFDACCDNFGKEVLNGIDWKMKHLDLGNPLKRR